VVYDRKSLRILIACCATAPSPILMYSEIDVQKRCTHGVLSWPLLNTFMESSRTNLRSVKMRQFPCKISLTSKVSPLVCKTYVVHSCHPFSPCLPHLHLFASSRNTLPMPR